MQEQQLFEYAIIRIVPRVEREEFLNAGVMLYCKTANFLGMKYALDEQKLCVLWPKADLGQIKSNLQALESICRGQAVDSPIARLDTAGRFRWLTAKRSTILQCSPVHPGLCSSPDIALDRLFRQMVED